MPCRVVSVVDAPQQPDDAKRDKGRQRRRRALAAQGLAGHLGASPFVNHGQQRQRRDNRNTDLFGGQGDPQRRARQGRPGQLPAGPAGDNAAGHRKPPCRPESSPARGRRCGYRARPRLQRQIPGPPACRCDGCNPAPTGTGRSGPPFRPSPLRRRTSPLARPRPAPAPTDRRGSPVPSAPARSWAPCRRQLVSMPTLV